MAAYSAIIIIVMLVTLLFGQHFCAADDGADPCSDADHSACQQTEYEAYVRCIHAEKELKRTKREAGDCPFATGGDSTSSTPAAAEPLLSTCKRIEFDCRSECAGNATCVADCPVCPLNADAVIADDYRTIVFEGADGHKETFQARIEAGRNVTTIIRLTNIINNTNTIHAPVNVTTTNLNNIHVHSNVSDSDAGGTTNATDTMNATDFGLGTTADGSCCYVVRPKTCSASTAGMRCAHKRHKSCGAQCQARVMHAQSRRRCSSETGKCTKKIVYIPEPAADTQNGTAAATHCSHSKKWPYVRCGGRKRSCNGCYDHYGYGFDRFYGGGGNGDIDEDEMLEKCHGCYDDGFDMGQMYRRGPVLRPSYYHTAPCYLTGTCVVVPMIMDCGYGCYGDQWVDPAWGSSSHRRSHQDYDDDADADADKTMDANNNKTTTSDEWKVEVYKCKFISDDGKVEVKNCTETEFDENPYAASPKLDEQDEQDDAAADEEYDDGDDIGSSEMYVDAIRHRRHAATHHGQTVHRHRHRNQASKKAVRGKMVVEDVWDDEMDNEVEEEPEEQQFKRFIRRRKQAQKKKHRKTSAPFVYDDDDENDEDEDEYYDDEDDDSKF